MNTAAWTPSNTITMPVARPTRLGPESHVLFWNPRNEAAEPAPAWFAARLRAFDPDLRLMRNRYTGKWQMWVRDGKIQHPLCQGWKLLFVHHDSQGRRLELDNRIFARLYTISAETWGSGKAYFARIEQEYHRAKAKQEAQWRQDTIDAALPSFDYSQIKVSGCGPSNGSKFATYFA